MKGTPSYEGWAIQDALRIIHVQGNFYPNPRGGRGPQGLAVLQGEASGPTQRAVAQDTR